MKFKIKNLDLNTGSAQIIVLDEIDAKKNNIYFGDRLKIISKNKEITGVVDIANLNKATPKLTGVTQGTIGLMGEISNELNLKDGSTVRIEIEDKPKSLQYIKDKLDGKKLNYDQINTIVKEIVQKKLSDIELTYFVSGSFINGLDMDEAVYLTKAIVNNGDKLKFKRDEIVLDKHCIGGVPGNRTTMLVVPIMAALGLYIPKTSSRSITSPAGTSDTVEVLANVTLDAKKIMQVVQKTKGCLVWGGGVNLASADDKLIKVRHPLSLDPRGMLLASIMAKKHSVSATHVLIDIPVGKGAKIEDEKTALELKKQFETIAKRLGMKIKVAITDGSKPIGKGIGPILEAKDVLYTLQNDPRGSLDLKEKAIELASELYLLTKKTTNKKTAKKLVTDIFDSNKAYTKFIEILKAQGENNLDIKSLKPGRFTKKVLATKSGNVVHVDNKEISYIARCAGAPQDQGAGLLLEQNKFSKVKKGDCLYTIYSNSKSKLDYAYDYALTKNAGYTIKKQ